MPVGHHLHRIYEFVFAEGHALLCIRQALRLKRLPCSPSVHKRKKNGRQETENKKSDETLPALDNLPFTTRCFGRDETRTLAGLSLIEGVASILDSERMPFSLDDLHSLVCPISLQLLTDPVIGSDGQTYDRHAITTWLREHRTSPITTEAMSVDSLIPNTAVKNIIAELSRRLETVDAR